MIQISHLAASSPTPGKWRFSVSWSETWIKKTVSRFKITQAQPQFEKWWQNSTWPDLNVNFENIVTDLTLYEYLPRDLPGSPNMLSGCDTTLVGLEYWMVPCSCQIGAWLSKEIHLPWPVWTTTTALLGILPYRFSQFCRSSSSNTLSRPWSCTLTITRVAVSF